MRSGTVKGGIRENVTDVKTGIRENVSDIKSGLDDTRSEIARNISELRNSKRLQLEELNKSLQNESPERRGWVKNQNEVRIAVHALLSMENRTGGIGQNISAIAREFNNSVNMSEKLEQKIQDRSGIMRLFLGGERDAAGQLANITSQNQARIQKIQQLITTANLDPDVRAFLEEQTPGNAGLKIPGSNSWRPVSSRTAASLAACSESNGNPSIKRVEHTIRSCGRELS